MQKAAAVEALLASQAEITKIGAKVTHVPPPPQMCASRTPTECIPFVKLNAAPAAVHHQVLAFAAMQRDTELRLAQDLTAENGILRHEVSFAALSSFLQSYGPNLAAQACSLLPWL